MFAKHAIEASAANACSARYRMLWLDCLENYKLESHFNLSHCQHRAISQVHDLLSGKLLDSGCSFSKSFLLLFEIKFLDILYSKEVGKH